MYTFPLITRSARRRGDLALPPAARWWSFDRLAGDGKCPANAGGDNLRINPAGGVGEGGLAAGYYGQALQQPKPDSSQNNAILSSPDTYLPLDGYHDLVVAMWVNMAGGNDLFLSGATGLKWSGGGGTIFTPWLDGESYGHTIWAPANTPTIDVWQHWLHHIYIDSGQVNHALYLDGALVETETDIHAADAVGEWGSSILLANTTSSDAGGCLIDELLIAPGWRPSAADVQRLYRHSLRSSTHHAGIIA